MIRDGVPRGQRSDAFHSVVGHLKAKGLRPAGIVDALSKHPHGIAAKYIEDDRLEQEVKRSYERWENKVTGISLDDFLAYSPARSYIFIPTGETRPAGSVIRESRRLLLPFRPAPGSIRTRRLNK
jgi:hypothetical protein